MKLAIAVTASLLASCAAAAESINTVAGSPVYTGRLAFPTNVFKGMYYQPKHQEQEPRPKVERQDGGFFPDSLNNPWQLPTAIPSNEVVMPNNPGGDKEQAKKIIDHIFNIGNQLFKVDKESSPTCNLCRTGLAAFAELAQVDADLVPDVMVSVCKAFGLAKIFQFEQECERTLGRNTYGSTLAQVLKYGNFTGHAPDAITVCSSTAVKLCNIPQEGVSESFLNNWFGGNREPSKEVVARWEKGQQKINGNKNFLRVAHVSDLHIDGRYMVGGEANCNYGETVQCCRQNSYNSLLYHKPFVHGSIPPDQLSKPAGYWGELKCDTPWALMGNAMDALKAVGGKDGYDLAMFTGDLVAHDDLYRYSRDFVEYSAQGLYDILKYAIGDAPLLPTLGNHDSSPENTFAPHSLPGGRGNQYSWDTEYMSKLWQSKGWMRGDAAQQVRKHYGGYSMSPRKGLRVISINTDFWYYTNFFNYIHSENPDYSGMLRFLTDELFRAEKDGERVWIIGHVITGWDGSESIFKPTELFYHIVSRFAPHTIAAIFFGHTHEDHFQVFYRATDSSTTKVKRNTMNAVATSFIAPSITTYQNLNPTFRVMKVDPDTYDVYDFDQYYTPVTEFDKLKGRHVHHGPVWRHLYSARSAYSNFSASAHKNTYDAPVKLDNGWWPKNAPINGSFWGALTDEIEARPELAATFSLYQSRQSPKTKVCKTKDCAKHNVCYMRSGSKAQGTKCGGNYGSVARS